MGGNLHRSFRLRREREGAESPTTPAWNWQTLPSQPFSPTSEREGLLNVVTPPFVYVRCQDIVGALDRTWFTVLPNQGPTGRDAIALAEGQGKDAKNSQAPKGRDLGTTDRSRPVGAQAKSPLRTLACGQGFRIWALQAPESIRRCRSEPIHLRT